MAIETCGLAGCPVTAVHCHGVDWRGLIDPKPLNLDFTALTPEPETSMMKPPRVIYAVASEVEGDPDSLWIREHEPYPTPEQAQGEADDLTADEHRRAKVEMRQPRKRYFVVKVTKTYEEVS